MSKKIISIILGGGKGKRFNSTHINKVAFPFCGKPLVVYGVELLSPLSQKTIVVIGAFKESVQEVLSPYQNIEYAFQRKQLGTGNAVKTGINKIEKLNLKPDIVLVGYGDHLVFYKEKTIKSLVESHLKEKAAVSFITTKYPNPNELAWGRILRNEKDEILGIIEQKDATVEQNKIQEINVGFYCFEYSFLKGNINKLKKSPVSGEYYITDMIELAVKENKKIAAHCAPFETVGIGINSKDDWEKAEELFKKTRKC